MGNPADSPLKPKGWFSRKHETGAAHSETMIRFDEEKSPVARQARAAERDLERVARTPAEQLAVLDARLGTGAGAVRERARLAMMADGKKA